MKRILTTLALLATCANLGPGALPVRAASPMVLTGAEVLMAGKHPIDFGPRIGLITNRSAVTHDGLPDAVGLARLPGLRLVEILSPEHGYGVDHQDRVGDSRDPETGVPVRSLYGKTLAPTQDMLEGLDALAFDIQDVGARFYTYISTMLLAMKAARKAGLTFVVLDRPNPIGGTIMEGGVLDPAFQSFTGCFPIPVRHGMTTGELARYFNREVGCNLRIVPVEGWTRSQWWSETGRAWQKPSPAMRDLDTAVVYPGSCFFEATNVDCRIGDRPFERLAAPWLDADRVLARIVPNKLSGVRIVAETIPADAPRQDDMWPGGARAARGLHLIVTDRNQFRPVRTAIFLMAAIQQVHGDRFKVEARGFDRLAGTDMIRKRLTAGEPPEDVLASWETSLPGFSQSRQEALLYP